MGEYEDMIVDSIRCQRDEDYDEVIMKIQEKFSIEEQWQKFLDSRARFESCVLTQSHMAKSIVMNHNFTMKMLRDLNSNLGGPLDALGVLYGMEYAQKFKGARLFKCHYSRNVRELANELEEEPLLYFDIPTFNNERIDIMNSCVIDDGTRLVDYLEFVEKHVLFDAIKTTLRMIERHMGSIVVAPPRMELDQELDCLFIVVPTGTLWRDRVELEDAFMDEYLNFSPDITSKLIVDVRVQL